MNSSLPFTWIAGFEDGSVIKQFDGPIEHKFVPEIRDNFDKLTWFILMNGEKKFIVDLKLGLISNGLIEYSEIQIKNDKHNIRLIYNSKRKAIFNSENLKCMTYEVIYFLGYQYLDSNNINHKIIFQIDKNGSFIIGE